MHSVGAGASLQAKHNYSTVAGLDRLEDYEERERLRYKGKKVPEIVVGTDDNGIFATNLFNEYACIYEAISKEPDLKPYANQILERYIKNATLYKF